MAEMEPPPAFKVPPKEPLQQLSPERVNTRTISTTSRTTDGESTAFPPPSSTISSPTRKANLFADYHPTTPSKPTGFGLPQSPSLPEIHALRSGHVRTNSDVQGLVKRFEHLDVRDKDAESAERRKKHEAELRRAQIAREEAESDARRFREECRRLKKENEEGRDRERRVGRRLEVVVEDFASAKEQYASQAAVYEKEVRKARKEAFKTSSAFVKVQEELKSTKSSLRNTQSDLDLEKHKVQRREQETFNAQYQLAAVQEELDKLRAQLKIAEEERAALKTTLKDEEVAKIAADGLIALPATKEEDDDLFSSPRKWSPLSDDKENMPVSAPATPSNKARLEKQRLQDELKYEQMRREHAEEMVDFLGLECRFRCCRCQTQHIVSEVGTPEVESMEDIHEAQEAPVLEEDVDRSMTMTAEEEVPIAPHPTPAEPAMEGGCPTEEAEDQAPPSENPQPSTPVQQSHHRQASIRTITTTTTIPMHFTPKPVQFSHLIEDAENIPPPNAAADSQTISAGDGATFDRAAALAAIQYRRGRAKSFAAGHLTPRKQMVDAKRRDISAPAF